MRHDSAPEPRRRVALFGQFGVGNIGNDASLEAIVLLLRRIDPNLRLSVICNRPDIVAARFGIPSINWQQQPMPEGLARRANEALFRAPSRLMAPLRSIRVMRNFDLLVVPGTGLLDDFGERPGGVPYTVLRWIAAARLVGCPVAMASIGAGPIHHPVSRFLMMSAARLSNRLSFRDAASRDYVLRHGRTGQDSIVLPDMAFALPRPAAAAEPRVDLALGVMRYRGWSNVSGGTFESYIDRLAAFAGEALSHGRRIRLVIGETSDEEAVEALRSAIATRSGAHLTERLIYEPARDLNDVMRQMASADIAIATRFHNVVAALMVGTPVISLSYGAKNDRLLEAMGLGEYTAHVESFEPSWIAERVTALEAQRGPLAAELARRVDDYRSTLAKVGHDLMSILGSEDHALPVPGGIPTQEVRQ